MRAAMHAVNKIYVCLDVTMYYKRMRLFLVSLQVILVPGQQAEVQG